MEVLLLGKNSIKIRGKNASFVVDPTSQIPKTNADGVIFLEDKEGFDVSRVLDKRVILKGPGEYEVGGIKVSSQRSSDKFVYSLNVDNIEILLGKTSTLNKSHQEIRDYKVLILNVDSNIEQSLVTSFEPSFIILYGEGSKDSMKILGKENFAPVKKLSMAFEKLPTETEVVLLG